MTTIKIHAYTSTACHHRLHDQCRKVCKFCDHWCLCDCHGPSVGEQGSAHGRDVGTPRP